MKREREKDKERETYSGNIKAQIKAEQSCCSFSSNGSLKRVSLH